MGQPETFTVNYALYVDTYMWPSESNRDAFGHPELFDVTTMPANRAASCLAKLVRWARVAPQGDLAMHPLDVRENLVRDSPLAQVLAARALSLPDIGSVYALYHQAGDLPTRQTAKVSDVLSAVFDALSVTNPLANYADLSAPAGAAITAILDRWDIVEKADS